MLHGVSVRMDVGKIHTHQHLIDETARLQEVASSPACQNSDDFPYQHEPVSESNVGQNPCWSKLSFSEMEHWLEV